MEHNPTTTYIVSVFEKPVRVALGKSGSAIYKVERVAQAADILLNR